MNLFCLPILLLDYTWRRLFQECVVCNKLYNIYVFIILKYRCNNSDMIAGPNINNKLSEIHSLGFNNPYFDSTNGRMVLTRCNIVCCRFTHGYYSINEPRPEHFNRLGRCCWCSSDILQCHTVSELFIHKCLKRHIFKFTRININKQITSFLNIWFYLFSSSFTYIYNLNRYLRLYWLCYTQVHNVCLISDCRNNQYLRTLICIGVHFMI